ncbi:MAG TPA: aromatic ring-hydroxylating dioxygenase subunit alpha [Gammaproteobacteria bacterium]|nr:aromatic ring-hydroxylating dioxygenase subunit alpha [Gammaproteobacteria bacterium]
MRSEQGSPALPAVLERSDLAPQPLAGAWTLPACAYTDEAVAVFEGEAVFARSWQCIGRSDAVREAGAHIVAEVAGRPILAVRGNDGLLRGFFNVCKHRGGPLALADGCSPRLQCKYHGWTYTLEGQLRSAPEMREADAFRPEDIRLDPVFVGEWQGFVFAAIGAPPADLDATAAGIVGRIAPLRLDGLGLRRRVSYELACNWKLYVDNYLEGYHLPHVHPGLNRLLDCRHYTTELAAWYSDQTSPLRGEGNIYGEGAAHYLYVWPNLMLNVLPGRLQLNLVVPVSVRECRVLFDYYYADGDAAGASERIDADLAFSDEVQREDVAICERVQRGLESGAYRAGRLSPKREAGVHHFQNLWRAACLRMLGEAQAA